jgi:hypothetical protein
VAWGGFREEEEAVFAAAILDQYRRVADVIIGGGICGGGNLWRQRRIYRGVNVRRRIGATSINISGGARRIDIGGVASAGGGVAAALGWLKRSAAAAQHRLRRALRQSVCGVALTPVMLARKSA